MEHTAVALAAFQYDGDLKNSHGEYYVPDWAVEAFENGTIFYKELRDKQPCELFIKTRTDIVHVPVGNYIIRDTDGEIITRGQCNADTTEKAKQNTDYFDKQAELKKAAEPLLDFLYKYGTPHSRIIVEMDGAELVSGDVACRFELRD